jgi:transcriptional regulator GlxA family with amidase domain
MERASELLREGSLKVWQVAEAVGYRQPAPFAKAFRRRHGHAPSELRAVVRTRQAA